MKTIYLTILILAISVNIAHAFDWESLNEAILRSHIELFHEKECYKDAINENYELRSEKIVKDYLENLHQDYSTDIIMIEESVSVLNHYVVFSVWIKGKEDETFAYFYYTSDYLNDKIAQIGRNVTYFADKRIYDEWNLPLIKKELQCEVVFDAEDCCVLTRLIPCADGQYRIECMEYSPKSDD